MPSYACKHPTCATYLPTPGYCDEHKTEGKRATNFYNQHLRNPESRKFYNSKAWKRARATKLATVPWCEECRKVLAQHVHHVIPLAQLATLREKVDQTNLMSVCAACHNAIEGRK
jgi:5-methylcytosine-specific restriction protein A